MTHGFPKVLAVLGVAVYATWAVVSKPFTSRKKTPVPELTQDDAERLLAKFDRESWESGEYEEVAAPKAEKA